MASPLTLILPVRKGLTSIDLMMKLGRYGPELFKALNETGTVHYARALLLNAKNPNLQPRLDDKDPEYRVAIITEYDGDFDDYVHDFVTIVGKVFDALMEVVEGGQAFIPVVDHEEEFGKFLAANNVSKPPTDQLFQAYPYTVKKIRASVKPDAG